MKQYLKTNYSEYSDEQIIAMLECFCKGDGHCFTCKNKIACNQIENYTLYLLKKQRNEIQKLKQEKKQ